MEWIGKRDDQSAPNFSGEENPFMQINSYGDEIGTILNGVPVFRTGYKDSDLLDYSISNQKFSSTLEYSFSNDIILSYAYRNATGTSNFKEQVYIHLKI